MVQLFVRGLQRTHAVDVANSSSTVWELMEAVQVVEGVPAHSQGLVFAGKQLNAEQSLAAHGVQEGSTVHLVLRLRGGKGGFGALLRGQGRDGKITTNYDACRDLQGRRLRHTTTETKLAEWQAQAKERELEEVAKKFIKEEARKQRKAALTDVNEEAVVEEQRKAVQSVQDAVRQGLASSSGRAATGSNGAGPSNPAAAGSDAAAAAAGTKRGAGAAAAAEAAGAEPSGSGSAAGRQQAAPKRPRTMMQAVEDVSDVSDSDEDDE